MVRQPGTLLRHWPQQTLLSRTDERQGHQQLISTTPAATGKHSPASYTTPQRRKTQIICLSSAPTSMQPNSLIAPDHANQLEFPVGRSAAIAQYERRRTPRAVIVQEQCHFSWVQSNKTTEHDPPPELQAWEVTPNPAPEPGTRTQRPSLSAGGTPTRTNRACTRAMSSPSSRGTCVQPTSI